MNFSALRLAQCATLLLAGCGAPVEPNNTTLPVTGVAAAAPVGTHLNFATSCGIGAGLRDDVLQRLNAARAVARSCGAQKMAPASVLTWNDALLSAAVKHSHDMAQRDYFGHVSPEGSRVGNRIRAEGYNWRAVGENLAGGDRGVDGVIAGWLASPGHCHNMMEPDFAEVAVACVQRDGSRWGTYWTMVLAHRR